MLAPKTIPGLESIPSPTLLIDFQQLLRNMDAALSLVKGNAARLWPHVKTHKCLEVIRLLQERGIQGFKCATIAEAELLGQSGAKEVLIAYQPTGLNQSRVLRLVQTFPDTRFHVTVDNQSVIRSLSALFKQHKQDLGVFIDIDCGMQRTGVAPGRQSEECCRLIQSLDNLRLAGAHIYDGHLVDPDPERRRSHALEASAPFWVWVDELESKGVTFKQVIAGGSPTFPIHAIDSRVTCSPGTFVFWDAGYAEKFSDLPFSPAAYLLTRVVSIPGPDLICLDAGTKSVASEMPQPRLLFPEMEEARIIMQSEEHMVVRVDDSSRWEPGQPILGIPWHICPTVALHQTLHIIREDQSIGKWSVAARNRVLTI